MNDTAAKPHTPDLAAWLDYYRAAVRGIVEKAGGIKQAAPLLAAEWAFANDAKSVDPLSVEMALHARGFGKAKRAAQ